MNAECRVFSVAGIIRACSVLSFKAVRAEGIALHAVNGEEQTGIIPADAQLCFVLSVNFSTNMEHYYCYYDENYEYTAYYEHCEYYEYH